ncbi:hypothetical protein YPPY93_4542, partial [Yersinia pestis PY-93]
MAPDNGWR